MNYVRGHSPSVKWLLCNIGLATAAACVISWVRLLMDCYGVPVNYRKIKVNNMPVFVVSYPLHRSFRDYLIAPDIRVNKVGACLLCLFICL